MTSTPPPILLDGTVLGEGVVVDARAVSFAVRIVTALIDGVAQVLVYLGLLWALFTVFGGSLVMDEQLTTVISLVLVVLVLVVAPVTVETLSRGRSLGKLVMGVRIVRDDGGPVRFRQALVRGLLAILEIWMTGGGLAVIVSFFSAKGKRLGDLMAGTYAMRTRSGGVRTVPLVMPSHLAAWARSADIRPLPDGYALAARQYLARAPQLAPASRTRIGQELAGLLEPYAAPGPPWGTPPEDFVAALLCERRDRDYARALREQQRARVRSEHLHRLPWGLQDGS